MAYDDGAIELHAPIKVRYFGKNAEGESISRLVDTTVGYIIFNDSIPQDLGFVDRTVEGHELDLEISFSFDEQGNPVAKKISKSMLGKIIDRCIKVHGTTVTSEVLDKIKATGYHYSTIEFHNRRRLRCTYSSRQEAAHCRCRGKHRQNLQGL